MASNSQRNTRLRKIFAFVDATVVVVQKVVSTLSIIEDYLFIGGKYTLCANAFTQFATVQQM